MKERLAPSGVDGGGKAEKKIGGRQGCEKGGERMIIFRKKMNGQGKKRKWRVEKKALPGGGVGRPQGEKKKKNMAGFFV